MKIDDIEIDEKHVLSVNQINVVVHSRVGPLCVNRYSPIGRSIMFYGEHGQNEINFCKQFIRPNSIVIDVGAHQGTHTIDFARAVGPHGRVLAFEPQRIMYLNLCASAALNGLTNIYAFNIALGAESSQVRIVDFDYGKRAHFSGMRISPSNTGELTEQRRIDDIVKEPAFDVSKVSFIKIDVEGMEEEVTKGALSLIRGSKPVVYCEYHDSEGADETDLVSILKLEGYAGYIHTPRGFNKDNYFEHPHDRFQGGMDHNIVCFPANRKELQDHVDGLKRVF